VYWEIDEEGTSSFLSVSILHIVIYVSMYSTCCENEFPNETIKTIYLSIYGE